MLQGFSNSSFDGTLLVNSFINDSLLFFPETILSNYADDNILFSIGQDIDHTKAIFVKNF